MFGFIFFKGGDFIKFIQKYKKFISRVLTVTVSIMLFIGAIPANAVGGVIPFSILKDPNGNIYNCNNTNCSVSVNNVYGIYCCYFNSYDILQLKSNEDTLAFSFKVNAPRSNVQLAIMFKKSDGGTFASTGTNSSNYGITCQTITDPNNINRVIHNFVVTPSNICSMIHEYGSSVNFGGIGLWLTSSYVSDCVGSGTKNWIVYDFSIDNISDPSMVASLQSAAYDYLVDKLGDLFSLIGNIIAPVIQFITENFIVPAIRTVGDIISDGFGALQPVFSSLFDNLILPVLNSILGSINIIATNIGEVFLPIIADIINFFSPYFVAIQNIVTDNFTDLINRLNPIVQDFITALTPSFDNIITATAENFRQVISALFVPDTDSTSFVNYELLKTELSNKIPVFTQLRSFFTVLFNPLSYQGLEQYSLTLEYVVEEYNPYLLNEGYYRFKLNGRNLSTSVDYGVYELSFTYNGNTPLYFFFISSSGERVTETVNTGNYSFNVLLGRDDIATPFVFNSDTILTDVVNIKLQVKEVETVTALNENFVVNVYGKNVSVLNFDWYLPYKQYGDLLIIAFCYLSFAWHLFKKLPSYV